MIFQISRKLNFENKDRGPLKIIGLYNKEDTVQHSYDVVQFNMLKLYHYH